MQVQRDKWKSGVCYGVNLLQYEMESRDRQNTIPPNVLHQNIVLAWADAIETGGADVATVLFNTMRDRDGLEAQAFKETQEPVGNVVCKAMAKMFLKQYPNGFPNSEGNTRSAALIKDKLKKKPINLPVRLLDILKASGEICCDAFAEWYKIRNKILRNSPVLASQEPFSTLFRLLSSCLRGVIPLHESNFRLVSCSELADVPGLLHGKPTSRFHISGLKNRFCNGCYHECLNIQVNGQPIFWQEISELGESRTLDEWMDESFRDYRYFIYFVQGHWNILGRELLTSVQKGDSFYSQAISLGDFWEEGVSWIEPVGDSDYYDNPCVSVHSDSSSERIVVYVNENALRKHIHNVRDDATKGECSFYRCCICVFSALFERISNFRCILMVFSFNIYRA